MMANTPAALRLAAVLAMALDAPLGRPRPPRPPAEVKRITLKFDDGTTTHAASFEEAAAKLRETGCRVSGDSIIRDGRRVGWANVKTA